MSLLAAGEFGVGFFVFRNSPPWCDVRFSFIAIFFGGLCDEAPANSSRIGTCDIGAGLCGKLLAKVFECFRLAKRNGQNRILNLGWRRNEHRRCLKSGSFFAFQFRHLRWPRLKDLLSCRHICQYYLPRIKLLPRIRKRV